MHSSSYSDKKVRKAIKCYYMTKAANIGSFFRNSDLAKKIMHQYIHMRILPEDTSSLDFLCIILSDLDIELYDLNDKDRRERLTHIHQEHFNIETDGNSLLINKPMQVCSKTYNKFEGIDID